MGILVGSIVGVVIVALCQMASLDSCGRIPRPELRYGYDPLRSVWVSDDAD